MAMSRIRLLGRIVQICFLSAFAEQNGRKRLCLGALPAVFPWFIYFRPNILLLALRVRIDRPINRQRSEVFFFPIA